MNHIHLNQIIFTEVNRNDNNNIVSLVKKIHFNCALQVPIVFSKVKMKEYNGKT